MTEIEKEVQRPDEAAAEVPPQNAQPQVIKVEDIKSLGELRTLFVQSDTSLMEWAKKRIQETNYVQAVQTELAVHKGDAHAFMIRCLLEFAAKQEVRIEALENLLAKALGSATKKDA